MPLDLCTRVFVRIMCIEPMRCEHNLYNKETLRKTEKHYVLSVQKIYETDLNMNRALKLSFVYAIRHKILHGNSLV